MRVLGWALILGVISNCTGPAGQEQNKGAESVRIQDAVLPDSAQLVGLTGKALAQTYCRACHAFPDPGLLDKVTWQKKVLPQMALRLGLNPGAINPYVGKSVAEIYELLQAGIYPKKAFLSQENWQKIEAYYLKNAPERLSPPVLAHLNPDLNHFTVLDPALHKGKNALTTLVKYERKTQELWIGDLRNWLFRVDQAFQPRDSVRMAATPVDIHKGKAGYQVVSIGSLVPTDLATGNIALFFPPGARHEPTILLPGLHRPVQVVEADLDQDALADLVVCNYGYNFGSLAWYRNLGKGKYQAHTLNSLPGARKTEVRDLNRDGRPDVIALFAQGTETIKVFYNLGQGEFQQQDLIQFPPVYGTNYFELEDFNQDGYPDILLANGDNADYSNIIKPYHGLRIFLNNSRNRFEESYFFPLPGAWKALARDFDQDGDLDIAAISYFPDFDRAPDRGFVYLEQTGKLSFAAATFSRSQEGRWFAMDAADYDRDGDEDIILGSCILQVTPAPVHLQQQWLTSGPSVLVLQNKIKGAPGADPVVPARLAQARSGAGRASRVASPSFSHALPDRQAAVKDKEHQEAEVK
jgi:FG-GAP-like repeat